MAFAHHQPGCSRSKEAGESPSGNYFCDCHSFSQPQIGPNGTDVSFPVGWTEALAAEWRARNHLAPPSEPGSGP